MEFLAMLYTVLLVAICLMMALLLFRSGRGNDLDENAAGGFNHCRQ